MGERRRGKERGGKERDAVKEEQSMVADLLFLYQKGQLVYL
jgi:hypothetical protein